MRLDPAAELVAALRALLATNGIRKPVKSLRATFHDGSRFELPVDGIAERQDTEPFIPTPFQEAILTALEGVAMRTDALGKAVGDRTRLFKDPGSLPELQREGLVAHHKRLGYYSVYAPPAQITDLGENTK